MRYVVVVISVVAVLAAACSTPAPSRSLDSSSEAALPAETLLLGTDAGPVAVRAPSGSVVSSFPGALAGAGGTVVYSASSDGRTTLVESRAAATGDRTSSVRVRGVLDVRVVSGSGRAVALMEPLPEGRDPWAPIPRATTTVIVADPTGETGSRRYVLEGNYEPEAFSTDDHRLYLIQHLPALAPTVYRVTSLDLRRGRVFPVYGPLKVPPERMPGTRLEQLLSPRGDQLFTLYSSARPGYAPHDAPVATDAVVSFVHVLDLEQGWAHCVGLPEAMWDRPAASQAMAASPDGSYLFVVDAGLGIVAAMHTESLQVRSATIDLGLDGRIDHTAAQMSADGETLFVATAGERSIVTALDARSFRVVDRWELDDPVSSIGLSSDGSRLYAAIGDRVAVLDPDSGLQVGAVPLSTPDAIESVVALAG